MRRVRKTKIRNPTRKIKNPTSQTNKIKPIPLCQGPDLEAAERVLVCEDVYQGTSLPGLFMKCTINDDETIYQPGRAALGSPGRKPWVSKEIDPSTGGATPLCC